ncbi:MAG: S8 family serine peptidase [Saprospiraceae bacterium]
MKFYFLTLIFIFFTNLIEAQVVATSVINYLKNHQQVNVLIELKAKADLSQINLNSSKEEKGKAVFQALKSVSNESQMPVKKLLESLHIKYKSYFLINIISSSLNKEELAFISNLREVKSILLDESISLEKNIDNSMNTLHSREPLVTWGLTRVEADKVWAQGYKGKGVTIAGEDTGYKWDVEGIKEKYRGYSTGGVNHNYNWHDAIHKSSPLSSDTINPCGYNLSEPCDDNSHGTHTMGTMVGSTDADAYGIAPEANWIGCRNMERGNGALSTYVECFEFFLAPTDLNGLNPKPELAPSAINNSWYCSLEEGCDTSNFPIMEEAIDNLTKAGVVVVVSAGNSGQSCGIINYPAAIFNSSLVVGAFAINDTISSFSSSGPVYNYKNFRIKPDVVAPGSNVLSRIPSGELVGWQGTSMAGPHVAGLVALIINANPALNGQVEKIKNIIKQSARHADANIDCPPFLNDAIPNHVYGYGKIMASVAVQMALITRVGNNSSSTGDFFIQPNPVSDYCTIIYSSSSQRNPLSIMNSYGELVQLVEPHQSEINLSTLTSGVYVLYDRMNGKGFKFVKM